MIAFTVNIAKVAFACSGYPQENVVSFLNFRQAMHWRFHGAGSLKQNRQQEIMITIDENLVFMALTVIISEIKHF